MPSHSTPASVHAHRDKMYTFSHPVLLTVCKRLQYALDKAPDSALHEALDTAHMTVQLAKTSQIT